MIFIAYMKKQDGILKRASSDDFTAASDQGFIPLLQAEEDQGQRQVDPYYEAAIVTAVVTDNNDTLSATNGPVIMKVKSKEGLEASPSSP